MFTFSSKLFCGYYIVSMAKLPTRKLEPWFALLHFLILRLHSIYINIPYGHAWNTVVMSELVLLVATWICWISYKNGYARLLVLHSLLLLNPWLIVEMWPAYVFSVGITLVDVHRKWLNWFHFLILEGGLLAILIDCMNFLSTFLDITGMSMLTVSFLAQLGSGILFH